MANLGVARRPSLLRRTDVRLTPQRLRALTLAILRIRLRGSAKCPSSEVPGALFACKTGRVSYNPFQELFLV